MKRLMKEKWGYLFLLPWFVFLLVFTIYPFFYGFGASLYDYTLTRQVFTGLENYQQIFRDKAFGRSIVATLCYAAILLPLTVCLSLWIANTITKFRERTSGIFKAIFYLPTITSQVALVVVWNFIFAPSFGLLANLFQMVGLTPISWFDDPMRSIPLLSLLILSYTMGQPIILYSAGIGNIPVSYYEAARIDGATDRQLFFKITLPMLRSVTTYILITCTIGMLQIFAVPYLMTGGGPNNATSTLLMMVYKSAFINGNFGYASAVGVMLFLITAVIAALQFHMMRADALEF